MHRYVPAPPQVSSRPASMDATDLRFPVRFADLAVPPRRLWIDGQLPAADRRLVAIVGSRAATGAAAARIGVLAGELAAGGWGVVSGGALGIDAAAHRGALESRGRTFAVLGCGIDVVYPDRHARLFRQIVAAGGALLSEYGPGIPPRRGQFPARNRLVAALGEVIVVGESRAGSGALITARQARALGRPVLAIPGSAGTDGLLAAGEATCLESASDVEAALLGTVRQGPTLPARFATLVHALGDEALLADELARRLGLPLGEALALLSEAELGGLVARAPGAKFQAGLRRGARGGAARSRAGAPSTLDGAREIEPELTKRFEASRGH